MRLKAGGFLSINRIDTALHSLLEGREQGLFQPAKLREGRESRQGAVPSPLPAPPSALALSRCCRVWALLVSAEWSD